MSKHPKWCPKCGASWWLESQQSSCCDQCGHRVRKGNGWLGFFAMFVPIALWILTGIAILKALGRHYYG